MSQVTMDSAAIQVFDKKALKCHRERCAPALQESGFLFQWAMREMSSRLDLITHDFEKIIQIGARAPRYNNKTLMIDITQKLNADIIADEEFLPICPHSQDLIISPLSLHSVNDLPGTLLQIKKALKPDGFFMAAMLGGETLYQLREAMQQAELTVYGGMSPRIAPFADMQQMGVLVQRAGFALPVIDSEKVQVSYETPLKLMHDLRMMGESNALLKRSRTALNKRYLSAVSDYYHDCFSGPDGRIEATFEIIFVSGWAPHDSQQKPLQPGSAKNRLADVLSANEEALPC